MNESNSKVLRDNRGLCSNKTNMLNLIIMTILWGITTLNYYEIAFYMKYIPGNLYINTSASSVAEIAAYLASGVAYQLVGKRTSFASSFAIAATGAFLILIVGE